MFYYLSCALIFVSAYVLNMTYMSVFFHRAFAHKGLILKPWLRQFVIHTGNWVTGLDLKGWVCMHRMHHQHVDSEKDPHSPVNDGVFGVFLSQHYSFQRILRGLIGNRRTFNSVVEDLNFPVSWLNRRRYWLLPLGLHFLIGAGISYFSGGILIGACYWMGIASHPIQGWLVNSLGHYAGYRNFDTKDHSTNNTMVGLLVLGEGYHNNHHHQPQSVKFSHRWFEFDLGYLICRILRAIGWAEFRKDLATENHIVLGAVDDSLGSVLSRLSPENANLDSTLDLVLPQKRKEEEVI